MLREDRDKINNNANLIAQKLRTTATELMDVREDRERLKRENNDLKE